MDYDGVTDINPWIMTLKNDTSLNVHFSEYAQGYQNKASFDFANTEEIAFSRSIPLKTFQQEPLHRFKNMRFDGHDDAVVLDITSLYLTLSIDCKNYTTIDAYIDFLTEYITKFLEFDKFIKINRIGIRKLGGDSFDSLTSVLETFERDLFGNISLNDLGNLFIEREYTDRFMRSDNKVKVNFIRRCRPIQQKGNTKFQAMLDLDGYVDNGIIQGIGLSFPGDFNTVLKETINEYLFDLYKMSVTEQYLRDNDEEVQN